MAFKMKGSPMARNFGVGSAATKKTGDPVKGEELTAEQKKAAMDNAMGDAKVSTVSKQTRNVLPGDHDAAKAAIADTKKVLGMSGQSESVTAKFQAKLKAQKAAYAAMYGDAAGAKRGSTL